MNVQQFLEWLALLIGLAGALVPVIQGLVAVVKTALGPALPDRYYPAVSLTLGVALAEFLVFVPSVGLEWRQALLVGVIAGLSAAKLFEYGRSRELSAVIPSVVSTVVTTSEFDTVDGRGRGKDVVVEETTTSPAPAPVEVVK